MSAPASNIHAADTTQHEPITRRAPLPKLLDNLLKEYAGVRYRYDERGNLVERVQNGKRSDYEWDAFNRMTRATTWQGVTTFAYDPLGRRIAKHSQVMEGTAVQETTRTMYGWDGDTLALESSVHKGYAADERTVHYVYERDSFVPLVQATRSRALRLAPTTDVEALMAGNDGKYAIALDPLWNGEYEQEAEPFEKEGIAFYQCDHLGTPQELTDSDGKVAWAAQYKAWGQAKEAISDAACRAGIRIRCASRGSTSMKRPGCITTGIVTTIPTRHATSRRIRLVYSAALILCIRSEPCWLDRSARTIWQFGTEKNIPSCYRKE